MSNKIKSKSWESSALIINCASIASAWIALWGILRLNFWLVLAITLVSAYILWSALISSPLAQRYSDLRKRQSKEEDSSYRWIAPSLITSLITVIIIVIVQIRIDQQHCYQDLEKLTDISKYTCEMGEIKIKRSTAPTSSNEYYEPLDDEYPYERRGR